MNIWDPKEIEYALSTVNGEHKQKDDRKNINRQENEITLSTMATQIQEKDLMIIELRNQMKKQNEIINRLCDVVSIIESKESNNLIDCMKNRLNTDGSECGPNVTLKLMDNLINY